MKDRFGSSFTKNYGWVAKIIEKDSPTFSDIEQSIKMDHMRPYYKLASHNVHANPRGVFFKLGLSSTEEDILLAGPSNTGFTDPASGTALSITQVTTALLNHKPNLDRIVASNILIKLKDEIGDAFVETQARLENN